MRRIICSTAWARLWERSMRGKWAISRLVAVKNVTPAPITVNPPIRSNRSAECTLSLHLIIPTSTMKRHNPARRRAPTVSQRGWMLIGSVTWE